MIAPEILAAKFPMLNDPDFIKELSEKGIYKEVEEGTQIMDIGGYIKFMPMMLHGTIKVLREDEEGNEIFLYYLDAGNLCASSLTCCMTDKRSTIRAIAESDCEFLGIPTEVMDEWMQKYKVWRNYVFNAYSTRFEELLNAVDLLAFKKMDERILQYLKTKSEVHKGQSILQISHQQIALDLNTSREVISRILKQMENLGKVKLHRGKIELLDLESHSV